MSIINSKFLCLSIILVSYTTPAFAYLDPGTGSMLLQGLIGGIAIAASFLSIYWQKVKDFFGRKDTNLDNDDDTNLDNDD